MSPEQITGRAVGPQSDLFAARIILYQFLTNERPFRGSGVFAVQQKILYDQPVPPSVLNPLLNPAFDRIVMRALAKRPEDRYLDAAAFREDLRRALNGESIVHAPPVAAAPTWQLAAAAVREGDGDPDATRLGPRDLDATVLAPRASP